MSMNMNMDSNAMAQMAPSSAAAACRSNRADGLSEQEAAAAAETTRRTVTAIILGNNRGGMWLNEGFYARAVESLVEAVASLDGLSASSSSRSMLMSSYPESIEGVLTPEQEQHICHHMVMHIPPSRCAMYQPEAAKMALPIYRHPIHLNHTDQQNRPMQVARPILEFNTALAYHQLGVKLLCEQQQQQHQLSGMQLLGEGRVLDPQQDMMGAAPQNHPIPVLEQAIQHYSAIVNRYCARWIQQLQQQGERQPEEPASNDPKMISGRSGRFLEYFLTMASLNNMTCLLHHFMNRTHDAMQCSSMLLDLHQSHQQNNRATTAAATTSQEQRAASSTTSKMRSLTMTETGEDGANDDIVMQSDEDYNQHRRAPCCPTGDVIISHTTPPVESNGPLQHGMIPYTQCFIQNVNALMASGVKTETARQQPRAQLQQRQEPQHGHAGNCTISSKNKNNPSCEITAPTIVSGYSHISALPPQIPSHHHISMLAGAVPPIPPPPSTAHAHHPYTEYQFDVAAPAPAAAAAASPSLTKPSGEEEQYYPQQHHHHHATTANDDEECWECMAPRQQCNCAKNIYHHHSSFSNPTMQQF